MQITKATEYALCAAALLASRPGHVASAPRLAAETRIPSRFLAKILRRLTRAGVLRSSPGARGGFTLARSSASVSVWDVVSAIESTQQLIRCVGTGGTCEKLSACGIHPVWNRAQQALETELKRTTLDEVVRLTNALRTWPKENGAAAASARPAAAAGDRTPLRPTRGADAR